MCVSAEVNFGMAVRAAFVPLTYFFFSYAHISVLCFFVAVMTIYIIYVILEDKCETRSPIPAVYH